MGKRGRRVIRMWSVGVWEGFSLHAHLVCCHIGIEEGRCRGIVVAAETGVGSRYVRIESGIACQEEKRTEWYPFDWGDGYP